MRSFAFACIAAFQSLNLVTAETVKGTPVKFSKAKHDAKYDTVSTGEIGEIMVTEDET